MALISAQLLLCHKTPLSSIIILLSGSRCRKRYNASHTARLGMSSRSGLVSVHKRLCEVMIFDKRHLFKIGDCPRYLQNAVA